MKGNQIFANTFLAKVEKLMAQKDFSALELEPLQEGEEVLGEMTDLEKAIFTLVYMGLNEINKFFDLNSDNPTAGILTNRGKINQLKNQGQVLGKLGWQIIKDRLKVQNNMTLRAGYKIVKIPDREESGLRLPHGLTVEVVTIGLRPR